MPTPKVDANSAAEASQKPACRADQPPAPPRVVPHTAVSRPISPANRWAVVVGIQNYAGDTHPTYGGRGDVNAVQTALLRSGWRRDHIQTLIDGQASGQAIRDAMSWLAARSGPQTFSLFHFSGHVCIARRGPCASGHTYLWSQDNRFISESTVGSILGRVHGLVRLRRLRSRRPRRRVELTEAVGDRLVAGERDRV